MAWDLSTPDWQERLREGRPLIPDLPLVKSEADEALGFFNDLRLPDVEGLPRLAEAAPLWIKDVVRAAFGSWDPKTRQRHINEIFVLAPKGSSKTSYAAGLGLTAMLMNTRKRAEFLIVADTQAISARAYEAMVGMIDEDDQLKARFKPRQISGQFVIEDMVLNSAMRIRTFDISILTGAKPVWVLLDELHLLGRRSGASKVLVQIKNGLLKNPEGLLITLTTQSDIPPNGVFLEELEKARKIRSGEEEGATLPVLYEFPPEIAQDERAWQNPDNWHMVLPSLGGAQRLPDIIRSFKEAKNKGEAALLEWASQQLNLELTGAMRSNGWAGQKLWVRGVAPWVTADRKLVLDDLIDLCEVITMGADGGGLDDLFGFAALGRERKTKRWLAWTHAFISPEGMDRRQANGEFYAQFIKDGDLTVIKELPEDVDQIVEHVARVKDEGLLAALGMDKWGYGGLIDALAEIGVTTENGLVGAVNQGGALAPAFKAIERKLVDGTFKHGGQRMMAWCAGNAIVVPTPTGMRIARDASGYGKIDPLIALFDAAALMAQNPAAPETSVYTAERGLLMIG